MTSLPVVVTGRWGQRASLPVNDDPIGRSHLATPKRRGGCFSGKIYDKRTIESTNKKRTVGVKIILCGWFDISKTIAIDRIWKNQANVPPLCGQVEVFTRKLVIYIVRIFQKLRDVYDPFSELSMQPLCSREVAAGRTDVRISVLRDLGRWQFVTGTLALWGGKLRSDHGKSYMRFEKYGAHFNFENIFEILWIFIHLNSR